MKKRLRLMGDNILVKLDSESSMTSSGLIVRPREAVETILRTGEVIATGPGKRSKKGDKLVPTGVEVGDGVVFNRFVASNTKTAEALHQYVLDENEGLIKGSDVLLVYDRESPINIS